MENWKKKLHVKSSLEPKPNQYAMFIGRWQPLHLGHREMFQQAINEGKNLLICIREGKINDKNPYTAEEVKEVIEMEYALFVSNGIVKVMVIPDICSVEFGRGVGYDIIEHIPPTKIAEVSATKIRQKLREDGKL